MPGTVWVTVLNYLNRSSKIHCSDSHDFLIIVTLSQPLATLLEKSELCRFVLGIY